MHADSGLHIYFSLQTQYFLQIKLNLKQINQARAIAVFFTPHLLLAVFQVVVSLSLSVGNQV